MYWLLENRDFGLLRYLPMILNLRFFQPWRCQIDYFLDVFVSSNPPNSLNQPKLGQKHLSPSTFKYDPTSKFFWVHIWILGCQLLKPVHQSVPWSHKIRLFFKARCTSINKSWAVQTLSWNFGRSHININSPQIQSRYLNTTTSLFWGLSTVLK